MLHKTIVRSSLILAVLAVAVLLYVMSQTGDHNVSAGFPPTSTPSITLTPTVTPTKLPSPGDTDGDGCTDQQENGLDEFVGGQRNFLNPWDYFNPSGDGFNRMDDLLGVIEHYAPEGAPPYDVNWDTGPITGPKHWNRSAPDGKIDLANDILGMILQYHHDCATPPVPGPTPPASAGLAFSIGVDTGGTTDDDCDTSGGATKCTLLDYTFTLNFYLDSLPAGVSAYTALNTAVTFDGISVAPKGNQDLTDWVDCAAGLWYSAAGEASMACSSYLIPPSVGSSYTGLIGTIDFNCVADGQISLVHSEIDTALFENSTTFHIEEHLSTETLIINCDGPTATLTVTPTPTPTITPTPTPCPKGGCPTPPVSYIVTSTLDLPDAILGDGVCAAAGGACTLRAAIMEVNANPGSNIFVLSGVYSLSAGQLTITADLNLSGGGGVIVDGAGLDRVFDITAGATVQISKITIRNGWAISGAGIRNDGVLTLNDSMVSGNFAGAIGVVGTEAGVRNTGIMTINDTIISNNAASRNTGIGN